MLQLRTTKQFERDFRLLEKQGKDLGKLKRITRRLVNEEPLEIRHHDHPLTGDWQGFRDCHIEPDWLLLYRVDKNSGEIVFVRTGSHSALFG
ncbi:MAG: type II toxin-antitoxin system YafQ family toxin [Thermodesulfovibrionales bacterium]